MYRVLVVDDEQGMRTSLEDFFGDQYQLECVDGGIDAIKKLKESKFDLVLTDYHMRQGDGRSIVDHCVSHSIPVVVMTGLGKQQIQSKLPIGVPVVDKITIFDDKALEKFLPSKVS